ncbi:ATP-binding cassette domain-containing protein [Leptolinea tardivitalis]|uniref:ABC transporter domain-containing protein n=1 Tax=Leptolinea tardivitalis TaxID=229920 RepID=A0A0P6XMY9_9CHLR|nr:ATP-binding cassette domain-containing protein [Leptolinea tardivitalis]KPL73327.1 hypothetical protein ADM99_03680 [Leptolinea tardivitalis]GAP21461.1 ABC-type nitrate/sulfonate/bicarbonate transport system, ATPase component [Leptolinea tardivitalis]
MNSDLVTVSHLMKSFESQLVIDDLSFSISEKDRAAIFAPSGAGKTTLIQILAGLQKPDSGSFLVRSERPVILFQEPRLFPYMTVEENIFLPFKVQDRPVDGDVLEDYRNWLSVCELESCCRHFPYQLSGGMKQKVSIIRGFLQKPALVMMDEPFQSIGRQSKQQIIRHILQTNPDQTLLLVTHDPEEVNLLAHYMLYFPTSVLGHFALMKTNDHSFQSFHQSGMGLLQSEPETAASIHA